MQGSIALAAISIFHANRLIGQFQTNLTREILDGLIL